MFFLAHVTLSFVKTEDRREDMTDGILSCMLCLGVVYR